MKKLLSLILCLAMLTGVVSASAQSKALVPFFSNWIEMAESYIYDENDAYMLSYKSGDTSGSFSFQQNDGNYKISGTVQDLGDVALYFSSDAIYVTVSGMCYALEYSELMDFFSDLMSSEEVQQEATDMMSQLGSILSLAVAAMPTLSELFSEVLTAVQASDCYTFEMTETGMNFHFDLLQAGDAVIAAVDAFLESNETLAAFLSDNQDTLPITKESLTEIWNSLVKSFKESVADGVFTADVTVETVDTSYILTVSSVFGKAFLTAKTEYDLSEDGMFTATIESNDFTFNMDVKSIELGYSMTGSVTVSGETHDFEAVSSLDETENKTSVTAKIDGGDVLNMLTVVDLDSEDALESLIVTSTGVVALSFSVALDVDGADVISFNGLNAAFVMTDENTMEVTLTYDEYPGSEPKLISTISAENGRPLFSEVLYDYSGAEVLSCSCGLVEAGPIDLPEDPIYITSEMLTMLMSLATSSMTE